MSGGDVGQEASCFHRLKTAGHLVLQQVWQYCRVTVMLAEPGCITYPHRNKFSTRNWISCLECEIGFRWLADSGEEKVPSWETLLSRRDATCLKC